MDAPIKVGIIRCDTHGGFPEFSQCRVEAVGIAPEQGQAPSGMAQGPGGGKAQASRPAHNGDYGNFLRGGGHGEEEHRAKVAVGAIQRRIEIVKKTLPQ